MSLIILLLVIYFGSLINIKAYLLSFRSSQPQYSSQHMYTTHTHTHCPNTWIKESGVWGTPVLKPPPAPPTQQPEPLISSEGAAVQGWNFFPGSAAGGREGRGGWDPSCQPPGGREVTQPGPVLLPRILSLGSPSKPSVTEGFFDNLLIAAFESLFARNAKYYL